MKTVFSPPKIKRNDLNVDLGSKDGTKAYLLQLKSVLDTLGIANRVLLQDAQGQAYYKANRIEYLASVRNRALEPLWNADNGNFFKIIFLNDVLWKVVVVMIPV